MDRLVKLGALFLVLGLFLGLAIAFPSLLMGYLVEPLAISLWLAWRVVLSVDQSVYWTLLILVCSTLMLAFLSYGERDTATEERTGGRGLGVRLERWQLLLKAAAREDDEDSELRMRLRSLLASVIGAAVESDPAPLEKALAMKKISLPPEAQRYLFPSPTDNKGVGARLPHLLSRPADWFRRLIGRQTLQDGAAIEELLGWMESTMEIRHDE